MGAFGHSLWAVGCGLWANHADVTIYTGSGFQLSNSSTVSRVDVDVHVAG
jgi:hypothetical protein